jgi:NAD(P)-dependent dehydrogenase (short-subunit alcohol dehydrogenase family)
MDLGLKGKIAVVTGGTEGIGLACAKVLAQEGATVFVCGRSREKLDAALSQAAQEGWTLSGSTADVTDADSFSRFLNWVMEQTGRLDILINNAGRGSAGAALRLDKDQWQDILDLNLTGVWSCSKAAAPHIAKTGGGVILNISSISGRIAYTHQGAYPVSKAGVNALTKVMASELASQNIRVLALAPGFTETEMLRRKYDDFSHLEQKTILNRLAQPEEIGKLAAFLVSDAAAYITAEVVEISGGAFQVRDPMYSWE